MEDVGSNTGIHYNLYTDGLTIQTTLDPDLQRHAEKSVKEQFSLLQQAFQKDWAGREPWRKDISLAIIADHAKPGLPVTDKDRAGSQQAIAGHENSTSF